MSFVFDAYLAVGVLSVVRVLWLSLLQTGVATS